MNAQLLRRMLPVAAVLGTLALPATAVAGQAGTPTTPTTPTPTTAAQPAATAVAHLAPAGLFSVDRAPVTVPGRGVVLDGTVRPFVAGQGVLVKEYLGGRLLKMVKLAVTPSRGRTFGRFATTVTAPRPGTVVVKVLHSANAAQRGFLLRTQWSALDENVGFGSRGPFVALVQQRLAALHFYIPQTGVYDNGTGLAVDAYHRLLGWGHAQTLGPALVGDLLGGVGAFHVRYPSQGTHAEGDLSSQLLALVAGSKVQYILPISSGKPSTPTLLGVYRIYLRTPGYLPDGMYYSSFWSGGYAIHGYDPAPDYPASHGCMRLPIVDAVFAYDWLALGDYVDSYYT